MQVSILAAFVAGLISFLSPCVLPLVPGYISMLSGIGVEQLRRGEKPRGSLLVSSFAFVMGFSVVFVAFGASASAVGQFLLQNKNLLAPFAGAIIVLFGLHLIGLLGRIPVRAGLIVGAVIAAAGLAMWMRLGEDAPRFFGPAQPRRAFPQSRRPIRLELRLWSVRWCLERLPIGLRVRVWLDAVYRPDFGWRSGHGRDERDCFPRRLYAGCVLRRPGYSVSADSSGHQSISGILSALPPPLARGRSRQWCLVARRRVSDLRQPLDSVIGQTYFSERFCQIRSHGK